MLKKPEEIKHTKNHLASAFWLHRMNMLKKPEEIKQIKKQLKIILHLPFGCTG